MARVSVWCKRCWRAPLLAGRGTSAGVQELSRFGSEQEVNGSIATVGFDESKQHASLLETWLTAEHFVRRKTICLLNSCCCIKALGLFKSYWIIYFLSWQSVPIYSYWRNSESHILEVTTVLSDICFHWTHQVCRTISQYWLQCDTVNTVVAIRLYVLHYIIIF